ncbi:MAG: hypothetical protein ACFFD2_15285 [Promethearchaeota archaeon]
MFATEFALNGNNKVQHEIMETLEYFDYISKYDLSAVPISLINEKIIFIRIPDFDQYVLKNVEAGK